jgi:hypothetical protein
MSYIDGSVAQEYGVVNRHIGSTISINSANLEGAKVSEGICAEMLR